jgi:hypothetical protein
MLELDPPELPDEPDDPDEPEEEPDDPPDEGLGMLGEGMLEEDCCCAQPPMRNAEIEPMRVVFAAMTSNRRRVGLWIIAFLRSALDRRTLSLYLPLYCRRVTVGAKKSATAKLNAR